MNSIRLIAAGAVLATASLVAHATATPAAAPTVAPHPIVVGNPPVCLLAGKPPASAAYSVIKNLKLGKNSYGSVDQAITLMGDQARKLKADAIIDYTGSQRFGFWPWRFVRPIVKGTAVRWTAPASVDCVAIGGSLR